MNMPRDFPLAGIGPRAFLKKDNPYIHRVVLFLAHGADRIDDRSLYRQTLLESYSWKERNGFSFEAGYTHALEIMTPEAQSFRAIMWTMQSSLHALQDEDHKPGPYRHLLFPGRASLMNWKEEHAALSKRFSVHTNLEDSEGKILTNAFLLALYNNG